MVTQQTQEKYAELALRTGVNLQTGQALMINAPIEGADFTKIVVRKAYEMGAKDVHINWVDDELTRLKFEYAPDEVIAHFPEWKVMLHNSFAEDGAAILNIRSTNPDLLQGIDPSRVAKANKAGAEAMKKFRKYTMNDKIAWSIISIPTGDWAQKIFPDKSREDAIESLWAAIVKIVRVDQENPVAAWETHNESLRVAREILNKKSYQKLIFKAPGTHLEMELPEGHIWKGGSAQTEDGVTFNPNMPTEEVFSLPHKYGVNGTVASTKPLNYGGSLIDRFQLTFKDGKVVDFKAEQGQETLEHLLNIDEGSKRLGEVALVPHESPVSQSGLIFYNTLFDENASCHIALGKAYPTNLEGGSKMNEEELDRHGVNDSLSHVDFMIGSEQLDIDGMFADGTTEPVFRNGTWAWKTNE
ncbi:aminopeptidase [Virgibacillus pantothenticus]|uniref:Peptidase M29 n=1 Tax=Virgibacillus pantothenticus TaxID=1473 RepID=A0A0L0QTG2_VIRPA|nr:MULTISPECIES: aminopeptidase [Virgibacillus]API91889.1 aminopeptidase [Virgibacillus sp. 6R]KNE21473.1 peptidase M29 [Virgibacillus pantothenticus]MBS7430337.1 aminopeptidase [Virgibacillus sp. 19R1-5]MBU8567392.1 aminopeptidase [Virgibacillus pantothenticus]MBU8598973.1 aminopeptidase [Virgibacillus pantothenticus]